MRRVPIAAAILATAGAASPAHASLLWDFTFTAGGDSASGTLTTDDLSSGSYQITDVSGTFDGTNITGLAPTGQGPDSTDNLLYPAPDFLDQSGFAFDLAGGGPETIYGPESSFFFDYPDANSGGHSGTFSASLAPLPEPASAGLVASAIAAIGLLRRRRRPA
jgi:hypothetical protein